MKKKLLLMLTGASILVLGMSVGAFANSKLQEIKAYLNGDLKIRTNGQVVQLNDDKGNAILPITYNGTTYLPVRAVANVLDVAVFYDKDAYEVVLGERLEGVAIKQEEFSNTLYSKDPSHTNFANKDYKEVLFSEPDSRIKYTAFTPKGKYQKLYLQIAAVEKEIEYIEIKDLDKNALLKKVGPIAPEDGMQTIEIDIANVNTITLDFTQHRDGGFIIPLISSYYK